MPDTNFFHQNLTAAETALVHRKQQKLDLDREIETHIVTAIDIQHRDASDTLFLPSLLGITAEHFNVSEVSADKAYASVANFNAIDQVGATPYIPFKSTHTGSRGGLFRKAFLYYQLHRQEFLQHYHKRSNVETTFDMIKAKFRDHVRSKTEIAMANEVYCKVLCHNICCLIQSIYELGIQPEFLIEQEGGAGDIRHPSLGIC